MKVLYLANPLRSGTGGDKRSFEILKRINQYNIQPVIVVDDFVLKKMKNENNPLYHRCKIYSIKRPNVVYEKYFRSASRIALDYFSIRQTSHKISTIARQENVEFIVSEHEKVDFLLEAYFAAKICSIPWTVVFQLPQLPPYASTLWRPVHRLRKIYMFALYYRQHALVAKALKSTIPLAVSASIEQDTKLYFNNWNCKMLVLHPGVGVDNELIQEKKAHNKTVDAIFFSRLAPEKGIYDLPEIALKMVKSKPDLKFLVAGRFGAPFFQKTYEKLVTERKIGESLHYKGFLQSKDLYSLVKAARVLVYPSMHDAFPLVVLETLACGTPVVAYNILSITSNFPTNAVKTVPVGDCEQMAKIALKIINDHDLEFAFSKEALRFATEYSWEKVVRAEVQAYDKVLKALKYNSI